jgi:tryptophan-rich sensory protein
MLPSRQVIALAAFVFGCLAAGWLGSLPTRPAIATWYAHLLKPRWTPPDWVFAPVWTALYLVMGVAAWLVWRRAGFSIPLLLFMGQLALNVAWSGIFFGLRMPGAALAEVLLLWWAILATALAFWPFSRAACVLMVPYLLWVTYAGALNAAIWRLNP